MKKCIYLKGIEPELTFNSGEHIIPAGIGGIMKLPHGVVSDKINTEIFSGLELEFMRNSPISLPRQFHGPGKRGSFSPKKASKSNVHVMITADGNSRISLGYIKLGKPFLIQQVMIFPNGIAEFNFDRDNGTPETQMNQFIEELKDFNGYYKEIIDDRIPNENYLLGKDNKEWYLSKNKTTVIPNLNELVKRVISSVNNGNLNPQYGKSQVSCHQSMAFNIENYFRVCAKIAFNFLALSKGQAFVLQSEFDPIRNWIVSGGENHFVQLLNQDKKMRFIGEIPFPPLSHKIILTNVGKELIGFINFYGTDFEVLVKLCDNIPVINFDIDGYICDWQNKKEYRLIEFINSLGDFA